MDIAAGGMADGPNVQNPLQTLKWTRKRFLIILSAQKEKKKKTTKRKKEKAKKINKPFV